jgi:hypothetical protein
VNQGVTNKNRWKYLTAPDDDDLEQRVPSGSTAVIGKKRQENEITAGVNIRDLKMNKYLDQLKEKHKQKTGEEKLQEDTIKRLSEHANRFVLAKDFIDRNKGKLWRYGSIFSDKNEEESAEFLAKNENFDKLIAHLEHVERHRSIRSSRNMRDTLFLEPEENTSDYGMNDKRQTWIDTSRKIHTSSISRHPLPDLQKPKKKIQEISKKNESKKITNGTDTNALKEEKPEETSEMNDAQVLMNEYGCLDVDGDGNIDIDEMNMNTRLKELILSKDGGKHSQLKLQQEGRLMMARDFVERNSKRMWWYSDQYKDKTDEEAAEILAAKDQFAVIMNNLRAQERLFMLKSSVGVGGCLQQLPPKELPRDPQHFNEREMRRVKGQAELFIARKQLIKHKNAESVNMLTATSDSSPFNLNLIVQERNTMSRSLSEPQVGLHTVGIPRIFDSPMKLQPLGPLSVTKWKTSSIGTTI